MGGRKGVLSAPGRRAHDERMAEPLRAGGRHAGHELRERGGRLNRLEMMLLQPPARITGRLNCASSAKCGWGCGGTRRSREERCTRGGVEAAHVRQGRRVRSGAALFCSKCAGKHAPSTAFSMVACQRCAQARHPRKRRDANNNSARPVTCSSASHRTMLSADQAGAPRRAALAVEGCWAGVL